MHDPAQRRRSKRTGRERGCWLYIPGEVLEAAGFAYPAPPPYFRTWAGRSGSVVVRFYAQP